MVDIARPSQARKKKIRRILLRHRRRWLSSPASHSASPSSSPPPPPWIGRWSGSTRSSAARCSGRCAARARSSPEDIRWIPARTQGRVERIVLRPGAQVTPDTVILELSNPELEQSVQEAQLGYRVGAGGLHQPQGGARRARFLSQEARRREYRGAVQAGGARSRSQRRALQGRARLRADRKQKRSTAEDLKNRLAIEQQRLEITKRRHRCRSSRRRKPTSTRSKAHVGPAHAAAGRPQGQGRHVGHAAGRAGRARPAGRPGHQPGARREPDATSRRNCGSRKPRPRTSASASTPRSTHATASSRATSHAWTPPRPAARSAWT